mgnify:CR=1 FL=1
MFFLTNLSLPLISILSIAFVYFENRDMQKVNDYAASILAAVPLSLFFFIPFLLNRWLKMNFLATFGAGLLFLAGAYFIHSFLTLKSGQKEDWVLAADISKSSSDILKLKNLNVMILTF